MCGGSSYPILGRRLFLPALLFMLFLLFLLFLLFMGVTRG